MPVSAPRLGLRVNAVELIEYDSFNNKRPITHIIAIMLPFRYTECAIINDVRPKVGFELPSPPIFPSNFEKGVRGR